MRSRVLIEINHPPVVNHNESTFAQSWRRDISISHSSVRTVNPRDRPVPNIFRGCGIKARERSHAISSWCHGATVIDRPRATSRPELRSLLGLPSSPVLVWRGKPANHHRDTAGRLNGSRWFKRFRLCTLIDTWLRAQDEIMCDINQIVSCRLWLLEIFDESTKLSMSFRFVLNIEFDRCNSERITT